MGEVPNSGKGIEVRFVVTKWLENLVGVLSQIKLATLLTKGETEYWSGRKKRSTVLCTI